MNIVYSESMSLISAIPTEGWMFSVSIDGTVNSNLLIRFMGKLNVFINTKQKSAIIDEIILYDNAPIHHSSSTTNYLGREELKFYFIPSYWPENAPIEKYFSLLKHAINKNWFENSTNWRSEEAAAALIRSIQQIETFTIRRLWRTLIWELGNHLSRWENYCNIY